MTALRAILLLMLTFLFMASAGAHAQAPVALPAGMTQEQFDALVDAIARSVTEKLRAEGIEPAAPGAKAKSGKPTTQQAPARTAPRAVAEKPDEVAAFVGDATRATRALPALGERLAVIPGLLDERENGGRGPVAFMLLLGLVAVVAVTAEAILRRILSTLRARLAIGSGPEHGLRSLANLGSLSVLDGLGVFAVWLVSHGAIGVWFAGTTGQNKLASAVLTGLFGWRLYVLAFRIVLQPEQPQARLCAVDDEQALGLYRRISVVLLLIILARVLFLVLTALDTPAAALSAYQAITGMFAIAALLWLVVEVKEAARQWLEGLGAVSRLARAVGRNWIVVTVPFVVALGVTQFYGALSEHVNVATAMLLTLNLVVGLLFFETLLQALVRRLDSQMPGRTPAGNVAKLPDVVARCVRVAVLIGVAVVIAESWVVDVLGLVGQDEWVQLTHSSRSAGITLFLAFVLWEAIKYLTEPYMDRRPMGVAQIVGTGDGDEAARSASRLSTIMPLLRVAMAIVIGIVTTLIVLEGFGVNTVPLLAGASVLGLAVSFGSQTLVRDIVSGIFYLTDDAFRVGEYIDCGKAKGTVEGFTLRSIKLRHQNGQVHTIPFGQLGQITNFSRDWITVKFNLRFARDTDIEKLRKAAKKIGAEMMEVPEYKAEILAPFKMQGVADIADNALLCRFKFTVRPGNPALIQREAVKRMFREFPAMGISFATELPPVVLQSQPVRTEQAGDAVTLGHAAS